MECGAVARPLSYAEAVVADHCIFAGLISRMEWPDRDGGSGGREETWKVVDSVCVLCEWRWRWPCLGIGEPGAVTDTKTGGRGLDRAMAHHADGSGKAGGLVVCVWRDSSYHRSPQGRCCWDGHTLRRDV